MLLADKLAAEPGARKTYLPDGRAPAREHTPITDGNQTEIIDGGGLGLRHHFNDIVR